MLANHYKRDIKKYTLDQLDEDYKKTVAQFSPVYLEGSYWYVGPSYKDYYNTLPVNNSSIGPIAGIALYKMFN